MDLDLLRKRLNEKADEFVEWLREAVRISSVTKLGENPQPMLEWLEERMSSLGVTTKRLAVEGAAPALFGVVEGASDRTVLLYDHYDVQPPGDLALWESPPFDAVVKEGRVWGRGTADDKASLVSRLAALALVREFGGLPLRVKFLIEGEEESGSPHFEQICLENRELLSADGCAWECAGIAEGRRPSLYFGVKGVLGVELRSRRLKRDMHSARAATIPSATWDLVRALATIRDDTGRVLIPGFYDDIIPVTAEEEEALSRLPVDTDEEVRHQMEALGITKLLGDMSPDDVTRASIADPTANISSLTAGYVGEGFMTVLPAEASAKMDFRLVPEQDPDDIAAKLRAHLKEQGFEHIDVVGDIGERPAKSPITTPIGMAATRASAIWFEGEPMLSPNTGGSGPMHPIIKGLGMPLVATPGPKTNDSWQHSPNENARIDLFLDTIGYTAVFFEEFAQSD